MHILLSGFTPPNDIRVINVISARAVAASKFQRATCGLVASKIGVSVVAYKSFVSRSCEPGPLPSPSAGRATRPTREDQGRTLPAGIKERRIARNLPPDGMWILVLGHVYRFLCTQIASAISSFDLRASMVLRARFFVPHHLRRAFTP